jgi:hypothetical protein
MDAMPDEQIAALETATEALGSLVRVLQSPTGATRPILSGSATP